MSKTSATNQKKPLCFVVGPIGKAGSDIRDHADMLLNAIIKEEMEKAEFGFNVKRADEDPRPGMITDRIIGDIIEADLVIADLTGLNPNVFYELGIRHMTGKPSIHIAKADTVLPFDNLGHDTIFINVGNWQSIIAARTRLADAVRSITNDGFVVSNPITQARAVMSLRQSEDPKDLVIADMRERLTNLEGAMRPKLTGELTVVPLTEIEKLVGEIADEVGNQLRSGAAVDEVIDFARGYSDLYGLKFKLISKSKLEIEFEISSMLVRMKLSGDQYYIGKAT